MAYKKNKTYSRRKLFGMTQSELPRAYMRYSRIVGNAPRPAPRRAQLAPPAVGAKSWAKRSIGTQTMGSGSKNVQVKTRVSSKTQTGGYLQWEEQKGKMQIGKNLNILGQLVRKMKQAETKTLYKFQGIKTFDDNGYYWLSNNLSGLRRNLPFYSFDLTSCINTGNGDTTVQSIPGCRAYSTVADGQIGFEYLSGISNDGTTTTNNWTMEQSDGTGIALQAGIDKPNLPHSKDVLKWASINFNLWGAKAKSTKYVAQIVQFKDEDLLPFAGLAANNKRNTFFQSLLKRYVFNPISTTGHTDFAKYMKVIKSETFSIGPTSTTESDADPHVKTVKWFVKLNKMLNYVTQGTILTNTTDFMDQPDFAINLGGQNTAYVNATQRMYFILYSTNFGVDSLEDNVETPSFDISIRKAHTHLD